MLRCMPTSNDPTETSPELQQELARLADQYGPLGVALVATEQADKAALVRQWRANGEDMPVLMQAYVEPQRPERVQQYDLAGRDLPDIGRREDLPSNGYPEGMRTRTTLHWPGRDVESRTGHTIENRPRLDGGISTVESDDYAPAPFQCLDELENTIQRLDSWVSTFIGRMQPYLKNVDSPEAELATAHSLYRADERSPLENRILLQRDTVEAIIGGLDRMNTRLAL